MHKSIDMLSSFSKYHVGEKCWWEKEYTRQRKLGNGEFIQRLLGWHGGREKERTGEEEKGKEEEGERRRTASSEELQEQGEKGAKPRLSQWAERD